jgi:4-diphosphocytidyl-2-C-methyl-D-erythritol kinase
MVIKSYSKINLTLKVNSKSRNGLHEIQTFYSWINLIDKISITEIKKNRDRISFKGPFAKLVKKRNNTVYNLLKKLRELKLISNYYSIKITKNIPVFSGLGGGTSNAAFILKYLLKSKINNVLLEKVEKVIGTDFKLFFNDQGYMKNLRTIVDLKKKHKFCFVLIQPKIKCSTKRIYSKVKNFSPKENLNRNMIKSRNIFLDYLQKSRNDLQFIVERTYPIIKILLKDIKNEKGCHFSRLTGTGSVCYGLFRDQIFARKALNKLKNKYPKFWFSLAKSV